MHRFVLLGQGCWSWAVMGLVAALFAPDLRASETPMVVARDARTWPAKARPETFPAQLAAANAHLLSAEPAAESPMAPQAAADLVLIGASCSLPERASDVLAYVNVIRTTGGTCGRQSFGATRPLAWNARLFTAARRHSADMAARDYLAHRTPEGVDAPARMEAAGYSWSAAGENIAAGQDTVQGVLADWLQSDGHCRNLLNPSFTEIAVACVRAPTGRNGTYWTMTLGRR